MVSELVDERQARRPFPPPPTIGRPSTLVAADDDLIDQMSDEGTVAFIKEKYDGQPLEDTVRIKPV